MQIGNIQALSRRGSRTALARARLLGLAPVLWLAFSVSPALAQTCSDTSTELVSVQGTVEIDRGALGRWLPANQGDSVCVGDLIRVLAFSRAALRMPDGTVLRLDQNTTMRWTAPQARERSLIELLRGIIHVISRDPRSLSFSTPFVNAGLEGTEFVIAVTDSQTEVTVLEGEVSMDAPSGPTSVSAGERGTAQRNAPTTVAPVADAYEALRWALYYAPVLAEQLPRPDEAPGAQQQTDPDFFAGRAAGRLLVGRLEEAREDLDRALTLDPGHADARALQAAIAATLNEVADTERLAAAAVTEDPDSAAALIALSYARQARFDLPGTRETLESAVEADEENSVAWARLAEARLATGDLSGGREAAETATRLQPGLAEAHTVLGFAQFLSLALGDAQRSFETAIDLDAAAPLAHLGLGLALIRSGDLSEGRREIELAVLMDPNDALVRSYVAKAYHEERRGDLPGSQLELAKSLDPAEPTPWLYDALRKQSQNQPVEALHDLEQAAALNDRQSVHRSRLRIDEDLAIRSGAIARAYRDLGFERLALIAGWQLVQRDPSDYSGRRLLADTYSTLPRHQIARTNALFQSQMLQPLNITAIPPQLAETNLFILDSAGPADLSFNEFSPLLTRDHWSVQGSAIAAGNDTTGEHATISGIQGRMSYSLGHFGYETEGFRENNDLDTEVRNVFFQFRPNARTSLLAELRSTDTEKGDLRMLFDPDNYNPMLRQIDSSDSVRLGVRHSLSERSDLLVAAQYQDSDSAFSLNEGFSRSGMFESSTIDAQHLYRNGRWQLVSGLSSVEIDADEITRATLRLPFPPFSAEQVDASMTKTSQRSAYTYAHYAMADNFTATLGASYDDLDGQSVERSKLNPKLGLIWQPRPGTTLRAAAFRTLQGPFVSKDFIQPRLEPTEVAGFNQFYFGAEGDEATRVGIGVDQRLSDNLFVGGDLSQRDIDRSIVVVQPPPTVMPGPGPGPGPVPMPTTSQVTIDESVASAYVYWTPRSSLALSAELQIADFDNAGDVLFDGYADLRTTRLPLRLKYFHPLGFSAGLTTTLVDQSGNFGTQLVGPGGLQNVISGDSDQFWVADTYLSYRLPNRRGLVGLYVQNLTDEEFRFQDTDPENPRIMSSRLVSLRITLAF